jgi:hypothetical protein
MRMRKRMLHLKLFVHNRNLVLQIQQAPAAQAPFLARDTSIQLPEDTVTGSLP